MTLKVRRTKKYTPRRSSKLIKANKQRLSDLENNLKSDLGELLALVNEGSTDTAQYISQKTKNNLLRFGPEMQKIADDIGGAFPKKVSHFLSSVDSILHGQKENGSTFHFVIENSKIQSCFKAQNSLEQALLK